MMVAPVYDGETVCIALPILSMLLFTEVVKMSMCDSKSAYQKEEIIGRVNTLC